jgi:hypothetical protein
MQKDFFDSIDPNETLPGLEALHSTCPDPKPDRLGAIRNGRVVVPFALVSLTPCANA